MPDALRLWQETTNKLARDATTRVSSTYLQFATGAITRDEMLGIQATMIATAQRRAATFNDLLLAAELSDRLEREYNAVGIAWRETPDVQTARLAKALNTVIDADPKYVAAAKTVEQRKQMEARSIRARLERLTDGEVTDASQWARQEAMRVWEEQGVVVGWYRRVRANCCDFCRTLAGPGDPAQYVHPVQHRMATHARCHCSQGFVTEIEPWQKWVGPREQMKTIAPVKPATAVPAQPDWRNEWETARKRLPQGKVGLNGTNFDIAADGTPGAIAQQHLDAVLQAGQALNDELERRLSVRLTKSMSVSERAALHQQIQDAETRMSAANAQITATQRDILRAEFETIKARRKGLPPLRGYDISDEMTLDEFVDAYFDKQSSAYAASRAAQYTANLKAQRSPIVKKANKVIAEATRAKQRAREMLEGVDAQPGTAVYAAALREETMQLLSEIRAMGGQQTYLNASDKVMRTGKTLEAMQFADSSFPSDWHDALRAFLTGKHRSGITLGTSKRGFNRGGYEIKLSKQNGRGHLPEGDTEGQYQVAVHELGHSFESAVQGLQIMQWAYSHARAPRDKERLTAIFATERGYRDKWGTHYIGKVYEDLPSSSWEIFTMGAESLLAGSPYFDRADLGYDIEFRQFMLGVLSVL